MPNEAETAEHNGDIWSRAPTKYGAILAGKNQRFLLGFSINGMLSPEFVNTVFTARRVKDAGLYSFASSVRVSPAIRYVVQSDIGSAPRER